MYPHKIILTIKNSFAMFIGIVNIIFVMLLNLHANLLVKLFNVAGLVITFSIN